MGQIRHGCATTTHAIRASIQRSQASNAELSRELGINVKTVAKWCKRQTAEDLRTWLKESRSTVSDCPEMPGTPGRREQTSRWKRSMARKM